jgi:hypothetical protein
MTARKHTNEQKWIRLGSYCNVHVRIAKVLGGLENFDLEKAKRVAREDFLSDTEGTSRMSRPQLEVRGSRSRHPLRKKPTPYP